MTARSERDWIDRVDDGILVHAHHLSRLRGYTLRMGVEDVRASAIKAMEDLEGSQDQSIWTLRVERCNLILSNPDDRWLRTRTGEAMEYGG